jgi:hypothetical protein
LRRAAVSACSSSFFWFGYGSIPEASSAQELPSSGIPLAAAHDTLITAFAENLPAQDHITFPARVWVLPRPWLLLRHVAIPGLGGPADWAQRSDPVNAVYFCCRQMANGPGLLRLAGVHLETRIDACCVRRGSARMSVWVHSSPRL